MNHKKNISVRVARIAMTKGFDENKYLKDLDYVPWHVGEIFDSADDQHYFWQKMADDVINEHAPIKKMRVRVRVREKDVPFMTLQWKKAIRNKRKYARIFSKERSQENFEMKKKWRNEATKERRKAVKNIGNKRPLKCIVSQESSSTCLNHS